MSFPAAPRRSSPSHTSKSFRHGNSNKQRVAHGLLQLTLAHATLAIAPPLLRAQEAAPQSPPAPKAPAPPAAPEVAPKAEPEAEPGLKTPPPSSRTQTSGSNESSPPAPEKILPEPSADQQLPSVNASSVDPLQSNGEAAPGSGEQVLPQPGTLSSLGRDAAGTAPIARGQEAPGGSFRLSSPGGVISDYERGYDVAQGDVTFSYREFTVRGKKGVVDYNTRTATLSDDLTVRAVSNGREQIFNGQSLTFNIDTGVWSLSSVRATFPPELFPPGTVLEPLFIRRGTVIGDYENVGGEKFDFSSCDHDHYHVSSGRLTFERDARGNPDRVVLKRNALYVLGRKILPLPVYVLSLSGERSRRVGLQPTFGQNPVDGFFAKTVYDLAATSRRTDSLLIDALQKRGLGLGLQRELAGGAGLFYLYALSGKTGGRQVDARLRRQLNLSKYLLGNVNFDSTSNNSLAGDGYSAQSGTLSLDYNLANTQSRLFLSRNASGSPGSQFNQESATFSFRQEKNAWNFEANTLFNRTGSTGSQSLATLDNDFGLRRTGSRFDAFLKAELHDDLTGRSQINGAYQLERMPELQLSTDTGRLGLGFLERFTPGDFLVSLGRFNEPSSLQQLNRSAFEYTARTRTLQVLDAGSLRSEFLVGGRFGQALYSDNTARYDYTVDLAWNTSIGRDPSRGRDPYSFPDRRLPSGDPDPDALPNVDGGPNVDDLPSVSDVSEQGLPTAPYASTTLGDEERGAPVQLRVNYLKLRPVGYTPFQFDFLAPNEFLDARAIFQPSRKLRMELSGGRDIQNGINRDLVGTLRAAPSRSVAFDLSSTYSLEDRRLGDITGNMFITRDRNKFLGGAVSLGLRYSSEQSTFSTINVGADLQLGSKTRFQTFLGYNGFAKEFDVQQFRVVRDLHCFNLFATFDARRKEFRLDLALKAFPFIDTRLGINQFGSGFDPAVGTVR
jgi:hypothetical protein